MWTHVCTHVYNVIFSEITSAISFLDFDDFADLLLTSGGFGDVSDERGWAMTNHRGWAMTNDKWDRLPRWVKTIIKKTSVDLWFYVGLYVKVEQWSEYNLANLKPLSFYRDMTVPIRRGIFVSCRQIFNSMNINISTLFFTTDIETILPLRYRDTKYFFLKKWSKGL